MTDGRAHIASDEAIGHDSAQIASDELSATTGLSFAIIHPRGVEGSRGRSSGHRRRTILPSGAAADDYQPHTTDVRALVGDERAGRSEVALRRRCYAAHS